MIDLSDPAVHEATLEHEKHVLRIKAQAKREVGTERIGPVPDLIGMTLPQFAQHKFPERRAILCRGVSPVFSAGHIGQIYSQRGYGKTWLVHTLALIAAYGVEALGFRNPKPCHVLNVDGEMASEELQGRFALLCRLLRVPDAPLLDSGSLTIVAADCQDPFLPRLDTIEGQEAIEPFVDKADLIILDNRSCLFDPDGEKDPTAWQPAQDWLLSLRRRGKAVLLAHHSNRQGGARGISKAEDPMNLLLKLTRPDDYVQDQGARFIIEFDKARGVYGAAAAPFIASLTPTGWTTEPVERGEGNAEKKIRVYLQTATELGEQPKTATAVVRGAGINKAAGLEALSALVKSGDVAKDDAGFHLVEHGVGETACDL